MATSTASEGIKTRSYHTILKNSHILNTRVPKDNNAATHSVDVDSNIFYPGMMTLRWEGLTRDRNKKASVIGTRFGHETIHIIINQIAKIERFGNCRSRNLTSVLISWNVDRLCR